MMTYSLNSITEKKEDFSYKDLLSISGIFGHGVFSMTMLGRNLKEKWKLEKWLRYHPELYYKWGAGRSFITLYKLNPRGYEQLMIPKSRSTSLNYFSIQDIALVNAYLWENDLFQKWRNVPHPIIETPFSKIGIISPKWGVSKHIDEVDSLISLISTKRDILKRVSNGELKINKEESFLKIKNATCPRAFKFDRFI